MKKKFILKVWGEEKKPDLLQFLLESSIHSGHSVNGSCYLINEMASRVVFNLGGSLESMGRLF